MTPESEAKLDRLLTVDQIIAEAKIADENQQKVLRFAADKLEANKKHQISVAALREKLKFLEKSWLGWQERVGGEHENIHLPFLPFSNSTDRGTADDDSRENLTSAVEVVQVLLTNLNAIS